MKSGLGYVYGLNLEGCDYSWGSVFLLLKLVELKNCVFCF